MTLENYVKQWEKVIEEALERISKCMISNIEEK